ncbi:LysR family transcriptional regulator [Roseibium sp. SCP14]|uniref:LysR family transcriptional regulator n=1 Tax=Roseibium sp. SCP14 TaxID=3141375 RepID=UPI00333DDD7D
MLNALWLETFTTLCETQSFTKTAARLNMTQPGVSQHVRKLEAQVGRPLVSRPAKTFLLTHAGEAVLKVGLARRSEERNLLETIAQDSPDAGRCAIGCSGSFALLLYPRLIKEMNEAPNLRIHLESAPQRGIVTALIEKQLDIGILDHKPANPRLAALRIGHEELCLVVPKSFPTQFPNFARLQELGFIAHPDGFDYADRLLAHNFKGSYLGSDQLFLRGYVNQIGQIPLAVAAGEGFTILPRSGVEASTFRDRLSVVDLDHPIFQDLWMARLSGRNMPARMRRIENAVREVALPLQAAVS